ncbi:hypothetical protein ACE1AT_22955 [Pelatocladus sp. BLCC-F211]|uniref:hypothetical protein n=1 Tax=Pelatocladus sp. BLCC-F211 TaxID=3342752 RepID=UPI0035BAA32A
MSQFNFFFVIWHRYNLTLSPPKRKLGRRFLIQRGMLLVQALLALLTLHRLKIPCVPRYCNTLFTYLPNYVAWFLRLQVFRLTIGILPQSLSVVHITATERAWQ